MKGPFAPPFLSGEPRATALLNDGFRRPAAWAAEVEARAGFQVSSQLVGAIKTFGPAGARNLAALSERGTVCVVTGQQAGLFLGPLYTFYKALSCIAFARAVERETGARCVPIFWLQSEDHDYAEIAAVFAAPGLRLALPLDDAGCSVAHRQLPEEVSGLVAQLEDAVAPLPFSAEVMPLVREAYLPGRGPVEAFAELLGRIFEPEGLLLLDPRCAGVARLSAPLYETAVRRSEEIDKVLLRRGEELATAGLAEQVQVRCGSPLTFFHGDSPEGPRQRVGIVRRNELLQAARENPLRLSSSALLRPLVQDALLPSVAYVGGPAELGYLAQCAPLYPLFGVRPALAAPRARFRLIDARTASILKTLKLTPAEVEAPRAELLARLGSRKANLWLQEQLLGELPRILGAAAAKHPALERAARRTRASVERAAAKFVARHARLLAQEDETIAQRVDKVQAALFPQETPQERIDALPFHAARHGFAALKELVLKSIKPGEATVEDLYP